MKKALYVYAFAFAVSLLSACATTESEPVVNPESGSRIALSWENGKNYSLKPETSDYLISLIKQDLALYSAAKDITQICPKYKALDESGKLKAIGEFYAALALYESSWNVKSSSVDVGKPGNKDTYSVGLCQVSVVDQPWAGGGTKYTYADLQTAKPNLHLCTILIRRQLKNTSTIFLDNSSKYRYFAVALRGNRYSKIPQIIAKVHANAPLCK